VAKSLTYPARVILGAAMNPCPCGRLGEFHQACRCRNEEIARYRARISGPLLDRIDIHLEVPSLSYGEISSPAPAVPSAEVRARVVAAREVQRRRFLTSIGGGNSVSPGIGIRSNSQMNGAQLQVHCALGGPAQALLKDAVVSLGLSARAHDRILKVARTVADLDGSSGIEDYHIAEAVHYRTLDRPQEHMPKA
jgi:magnesium chelatase family protein